MASPTKIIPTGRSSAKKFELSRTEEMFASGHKDVDVALTTRELARMLKQCGIDLVALDEGAPDSILGEYSGAGTIFGATGGVMEAALRTAYRLIAGKELEKIEIKPVRGLEGIKDAAIRVGDLEVEVAVAHGLGNARKLLEAVKAGKSPYHFIEVMACPGGCVGGGGQPIGFDLSVRETRGKGLYAEDKALTYRKSHENPAIQKIYSDYLVQPLGEKSHHLLHTGYTRRG